MRQDAAHHTTRCSMPGDCSFAYEATSATKPAAAPSQNAAVPTERRCRRSAADSPSQAPTERVHHRQTSNAPASAQSRARAATGSSSRIAPAKTFWLRKEAAGRVSPCSRWCRASRTSTQAPARIRRSTRARPSASSTEASGRSASPAADAAHAGSA
ncbi:MAG: hypothetical protein M0D55_20045 [Elusimicrobiota bacterium]|nr:MAG: hypothetical protein M0D55_20045 [Elusimicrobiota bacterium]